MCPSAACFHPITIYVYCIIIPVYPPPPLYTVSDHVRPVHPPPPLYTEYGHVYQHGQSCGLFMLMFPWTPIKHRATQTSIPLHHSPCNQEARWVIHCHKPFPRCTSLRASDVSGPLYPIYPPPPTPLYTGSGQCVPCSLPPPLYAEYGHVCPVYPPPLIYWIWPCVPCSTPPPLYTGFGDMMCAPFIPLPYIRDLAMCALCTRSGHVI